MLRNDVEFYRIMDNAYQNKLPFVAYRNPNKETVGLIVQQNDNLYFTKNYQESGFVFAPFDNREPSILFPLSESTLYSYIFSESKSNGKSNSTIAISNSKTSKVEHIKLVQKGIDFLGDNNYKKVVLSRKEIVPFDEFKVFETFKRLLSNYNNAFVYCWFHPKVGLWLGATPETLLKVKETLFSTMALAGTQVYMNDKDIAWKPKEIQEQQYVTDFILEQLNKSKFERNQEQIKFKVSKPYSVKAGSLLHLRTDISGKITESFTLDKIINLLHPTPAVCGVPQDEAKTFILKNENYNRQFYTGFLGELNLNKISNLYVNLRCMQVLKDRLEIYVGGGITKDSNPESEWKETVAKSKVMLCILS